jgi:aminopeptidase N
VPDLPARLRATLLAAAALTAPAGVSAQAPPTQLPRDVRPIHYDLYLAPDGDALHFNGQVAIALEVLRRTRRIMLNAAELDIRTANLSGTFDDEAGAGAPELDLDPVRQTATLQFPRPIDPGRYSLVIEYRGRINRQANGLFAIDYADGAATRRALFTQLAPAAARSLLPCWDEPALKASFALEVRHPAGSLAVSNMPLAGTQDDGPDWQRSRFAPTPRMSSYLLFLAVGDFERSVARTGAAGEVAVGVVTRRGATAQATLVRDAMRDLVPRYAEYFAIPYGLPKLDNVAAPGSSQFFAAMENWGAILTFESSLLLDPAVASEDDRQFVWCLAAHEIAHQWFGNLVTMAWWDDLWLNEGFATWLGNRATHWLNPDWQLPLNAVAARERAMALDALSTTHPVIQPIGGVSEINQAFDAISYQKGAAVITMLEDFVGETAWRDGVRAYLARHRYGNARSADLWAAVAAARLPLERIADDFTRQPGVPLVRLHAAHCRDGRTTLELEQAEFSLDQPGRATRRWRIPIVAASAGGTPGRTVLARRRGQLVVEGCGPVVVNAGQAGYYRVHYPPGALAELAAQLAAVPAIDQLGLLADSWALAQAGLQPASGLHQLVAAVPATAEPQVWRQVVALLRQANRLAAGADGEPLRAWSRAVLAPAFARVGWEPVAAERPATAILRAELIEALGSFDDEAVIATARARWGRDTTGEEPLPGELRQAILTVVARHADARTWETLRGAALAETVPTRRTQALELLGAARDESLARAALEFALSGATGATDGAELIRAVARTHPDLAFDFALAHRDAVLSQVDAFARDRYLARLAERSVDPAMPAKIRAYADAYLASDARGGAAASAAAVALNVRVRAAVLPELLAAVGAPPRSQP